MTWRQRLEAAIAGRAADVIPAVFRLDKWYLARVRDGDLPAELAGMSMEQVEAHLGLGQSARVGHVFKTVLRPPVECVKTRRGDELVTEWHTPQRSVRMVQQWTRRDEAAGLAPTTIEHPIKDLEDYAAYETVVRHTEFVPTYDEYRRYDGEVGDAGLPLVVIGPIPMHDLLVRWVGYEQAYLHLYDRPDVVLQAAATGNEVYRRMWSLVAESPAQLVMHGVNFDSQMTPPTVFREHFLPYLTAFNRVMHEAGKRVAFHGDGDMTALLGLVVEADYDVCECFACQPLVRCTVAQARAAWRDRITIWGGLPSGLLEPNVSLDDLQAHLEDVYAQVAPGDRFILGISDQAMPTAGWEHIALTAKFAREHGRYPLDPRP